MKTLHRFSYLLLIAVLLTSSSCIGKLFGGDDDDDGISVQELNDRIQGNWEVTSWMIDNEEAIPDVIESFNMNFNDDDIDTGTVNWEIESKFPNVIESGIYRLNYQISDGATAITLDDETYNISLNGDRMTLRSQVDADENTLHLKRD